MSELANAAKVKQELEHKIRGLEKDLENEMDYNLELFSDQQTTLLCQRAYFSYQLL